MKKLYFENKTFLELKKEFLEGKVSKKQIFNFLNAYSVYLFRIHKRFKNSIFKYQNLNFPDGATLSFVLFLLNFKKIKRLKGPNFTYSFLSDCELNKNKKHLFIGLDKNSLSKLRDKFKNLQSKNLFYHEMPLIKQEKYVDRDLIKKINVLKPDYIWVGLGNPKQEILSNDLFNEINQGAIFNVGAAFDYIKDKKKKAPSSFGYLGLEWFYRMVTDFSHTFPKVIKSFFGQFYLPFVVRLRK